MNTTRSEAQWPYDEGSDQVHSEQQRDQARIKADLDDAFRIILDYLPEVWDKTLKDAVDLIQWRL